MIPQDVFQPLHQSYQGICILNWNFRKKYQNESATKIFTEKCPDLFRQLERVCRNFNELVNQANNLSISHSGMLHYTSGTVAYSCLRLGQKENTSFFIIFDYIPRLENDFSSQISFTPREKEILQIMAMGKTNKEISQMLSIGLETVKSHIRNIFAKTGASSRVELIGKVMQLFCYIAYAMLQHWYITDTGF